MCKRIIILARKYSILCEEPVCTEQGNAALMCKRTLRIARKNSICEETGCTEQGIATLIDV